MHPLAAMEYSLCLLVLFCLLLVSPLAAAQQAQQMLSFSGNDGGWRPIECNRTLVSANGDFAAGFVPSTSTPGSYRFAVWVVDGFSDSDSNRRTVIWYAHNHSTSDYSPYEADGTSTLAVDGTSTLAVDAAAGALSWTAASAGGGTDNKPIWSLVASSSGAERHTAAAVLRLNNSGSLCYGASWSSFAEPTDTVMAGQAIPNGNDNNGSTTLRSNNGRYRVVNSAMLQFNDDSLSSGTMYYTYYNISNSPLLHLTADGTLKLSNNGELIASDQGSTKRVRRLTLDDDGNLRLYSLVPDYRTRHQWRVVWQLVQNVCTILGTCAAGRVCVPVPVVGNSIDDKVSCICPPGYHNATQEGPCKKKKNNSDSGNDDDETFVRMDFVVFSGGATINPLDPGPLMRDLAQQSQEDCESMCRRNATCVAYGYKFGGHGAPTCHHYMGRLVGGYWSPETEMATFLRVSASSDKKYSNPFTGGMTSKIEMVCPVRLVLPAVQPKMAPLLLAAIIMAPVLFVAEVLAGALSIWAFLRKYSRLRREMECQLLPSGGGGLRRFSSVELKSATRGFSDVVGRGAYGTVYRGELADHRAVAVKQLHGMGGGDEEFWAEVTIIGRLHHLNLVRLCGFCADRREQQRMLVYEYVPNGLLDKHLFAVGGLLLDLHTRYRIAVGVARAIAYLHEECLEWVLHCDIKPENILLEEDFCPKVSDFGLSKLTNKQDRVTMSRIRGTRGYMAPEWVIHGQPITAKADVYSFGMVLLEIVSGRRSCSFRQESVGSDDWYFPKWAYEKLYVERRIDDILDPRIDAASYEDAACLATVDRMVKTAIWCLQDRAEMRPSMGRVAKMLEGSVEIADPVKPTIFCLQDDYCSSDEALTSSTPTPPAPTTLTDYY